MTLTFYGYGEFTHDDAICLDSTEPVTITTHGDIEKRRPGRRFARRYPLYVRNRPYVMLFVEPPGLDKDLPVPVHIIYLVDVAAVSQ